MKCVILSVKPHTDTGQPEDGDVRREALGPWGRGLWGRTHSALSAFYNT